MIKILNNFIQATYKNLEKKYKFQIKMMYKKVKNNFFHVKGI